MAGTRINEFNQEIGFPIENWHSRELPQRITLTGEYCELQPLDSERHATQLFEALKRSGNEIWTYVPCGPFAELEDFKQFVINCNSSDKSVFFAIVDKKSGRAVGTVALINVDEKNGSIEAGYVVYSVELKKTPVATEAQYLLMKYVFEDLKYRRYEWKCDSLNKPSESAALRLGFTFEGTFRQVVVYKGRSRDSTYLSVIDSEWKATQEVFEKWLSADNLVNGVQRCSLNQIRDQCRQKDM